MRNVAPMEYRSLGRTGIQVSPLCLGAMMFGGWGEPDHETSIATIHAALDAGINFIDTADVYSQGESEVIVGKALAAAGATTWCSPRRSTCQMGVPVEAPAGTTRGSQQARKLSALDRQRSREQPAPAEHRLDRPVPDSPPRPGHRHRRDAGRSHRSAAARQDPRLRLVDVSRPPDRSGAMGQRAARPRPLRHRAAAVLAAGPRNRGRRSAGGAGVRDGCAALEPAGRWLARRGLPQGHGHPRIAAPHPIAGPIRHVHTRRTSANSTLPMHSGNWPTTPDLSLIHLALAFVMQHPAVTAPIIGPRTLDHLKSQLGATEVTLVHGHPRQDRRDRAAWVDDLSRRPGLSAAVVDRSVLETPPHRDEAVCA